MPSVGLCFGLANLKNMGPSIGLYLVMTGRVLRGKETVQFGICTNFIEEDRLEDLWNVFKTLIFFTTTDDMVSTSVAFCSEKVVSKSDELEQITKCFKLDSIKKIV